MNDSQNVMLEFSTFQSRFRKTICENIAEKPCNYFLQAAHERAVQRRREVRVAPRRPAAAAVATKTEVRSSAARAWLTTLRPGPLLGPPAFSIPRENKYNISIYFSSCTQISENHTDDFIKIKNKISCSGDSMSPVQKTSWGTNIG